MVNLVFILVGMGCFVVVVFWMWIWFFMFIRVFFGGSFFNKFVRFIISVLIWWLGVYFIFMYFWMLLIIFVV